MSAYSRLAALVLDRGESVHTRTVLAHTPVVVRITVGAHEADGLTYDDAAALVLAEIEAADERRVGR